MTQAKPQNNADQSDPSTGGESLSNRFQFSLKDLFIVMTGVALVAGMTIGLGLAAGGVTAGLALATCNYCGRCHSVQTAKTRRRILYAVWIIFGASMFMPAGRGCSTIENGWEMAYYVVSAEVEGFAEVARGENPVKVSDWAALFLFGQLNLVNVLMVVLPWVGYRVDRGSGQWLVGLYGCAVVAVWCAIDETFEIVIFGRYVWAMSVSIPVLLFPVSRRMLLSMMLLGILDYLILQYVLAK